MAEARGDRDAGGPAPIDRSGMSLGLRLASEFTSAILVGGLLGYGLDFLLNTSPWCLFVGLGFGFAAGTVNLVRAARSFAAAHPVDPKAPRVPDDDDED